MKHKVAVFDMQPITPAVGGGRLRLLGLYHALGADFETRYVGTYDWPGEKFRRHHISGTLEEINVPLSDAHHAAAQALAHEAHGKTVIDIAFHRQCHLSPEYLAEARAALDWADTVVFSHPWVYPLLEDRIRPDQTLVYDSHNVEAVLRAQLLNQNDPVERDLLDGVIEAERAVGEAASLVLACSQADADAFHRVYGWPTERMRIVPNGVMAEAIRPASGEEKRHARSMLNLPPGAEVGIFVGSDYSPNVEAAEFINSHLAPAMPDVTFVIAGGVGPRLSGTAPNIVITGQISDEDRQRWLWAADFAVNPMFSGSGTNIKMFDFMAAGLPVVTTPTGARGVAAFTSGGVLVAERTEFASVVAVLIDNEEIKRVLGHANRQRVEREFSWERISPALGNIFRRAGSLAHSHKDEEPLCIAHLSTLGLKCGIGEYTRSLIQHLTRAGVANFVLGAHTFKEQPNVAEWNANGSVAWYFDDLFWKYSSIDGDAVGRIKARGAQALLIQYHPAFFGAALLRQLVFSATSQGIRVAVVLHNFELADQEMLRELIAQGVRVYSHRSTEIAAARSANVDLSFLPFGIDLPAVAAKKTIGERDWNKSPPVVVTTGFLRKHKGVRTLIAALPAIQKEFPGARLKIQCAVYPSEDSEQELDACLAELSRLGLEPCVDIDTRFLPMEEVYSAIASADIAVLPYEESGEGGSATLASCIAVGLPTIVSDAAIFDEFRTAALTLPNVTPPTVARELIAVLRDAPRYQALSSSARDFAMRNGWPSVAKGLIDHLQLERPESHM